MSTPLRAILLSMTALAFAPVAAAQSEQPVEQGAPNVPEFQPAFPEQTRAPASDSGVDFIVETFADGLEHPWGIDAFPDGGFIVTERPGRLRTISEDGELSEPVAGLPEVFAQEQGGLLDVRLGPTFEEDRLIYWTYSKPV
ncbi:MAG TPA: PQQ-dependent sugar dehydrogenase, partial [Methylomirabilota bacterium]|nr:PQQ-dependent sugar dehydrogenase [Methylomirabilota bacterium]